MSWQKRRFLGDVWSLLPGTNGMLSLFARSAVISGAAFVTQTAWDANWEALREMILALSSSSRICSAASRFEGDNERYFSTIGVVSDSVSLTFWISPPTIK